MAYAATYCSVHSWLQMAIVLHENSENSIVGCEYVSLASYNELLMFDADTEFHPQDYLPFWRRIFT